MTIEIQIFDRNGDIVLILQRHQDTNPTVSIALAHTEMTTSDGSGQDTTEVTHDVEDHNQPLASDNTLVLSKQMTPATENGGPNADIDVGDSQHHSHPLTYVHMLISSKHMILASSVFEAMLKTHYIEGQTLETKGKVEIPLPDDDPDAFTILLDIIHSRTNQVPRQVDLGLLTKLSILVDKYQMHEAAGIFPEVWMGELRACLPIASPEEILSWLCISWVFQNSDIFRQVTEILILTSDSEFGEDDVSELPIPKAVVDSIQYDHRQGAISYMLQKVYSLLERYSTSIYACRDLYGHPSACDAMLLGSILRGAQNARLWPFPEPPYQGFTVDRLREDILAIEIHTLCDIIHPGYGCYGHKGISNQPDPNGLRAGQAIKDVAIARPISFLFRKLSGLNINRFM